MSLLLRRRWRRCPRVVRLAVILVLAAATAALASGSAANASIVSGAEGSTYDDPATVPARPVGIVFGTKVHEDGTLGPRLTDRVRVAGELYRAGRVERLLLTGDSRPGSNEVAAMRDALVAAGVPDRALTLDGAGLDSYDSWVRARTVYGVTAAVLVTQAYHLPRTLYLCRRQGIDVAGLAVADWTRHPERSGTDYPVTDRVRHSVREWLARTNATIDTEILDREPAVRDAYQGLRPG